MLYLLALWISVGIISMCYLIDYCIRVDRRITVGDVLLMFVLLFSGMVGFAIIVCMSITDKEGRSINNIIIWQDKE